MIVNTCSVPAVVVGILVTVWYDRLHHERETAVKLQIQQNIFDEQTFYIGKLME